MKYLHTDGNKEYYLNADKKIVTVYVDESVNYRVDELDPAVVYELNKARAIIRYPHKSTIDVLIEYQTESLEKAINYVGYRLLGTKSYLDVFSRSAESNRQEEKHRSETAELKNTIEEMKLQQETMQLLMMNIAKNLNQEQKTRFKRAL